MLNTEPDPQKDNLLLSAGFTTEMPPECVVADCFTSSLPKLTEVVPIPQFPLESTVTRCVPPVVTANSSVALLNSPVFVSLPKCKLGAAAVPFANEIESVTRQPVPSYTFIT